MSQQPPLLDEARLTPVSGASTVEPDFLGYTPASWVKLAASKGPVFRQTKDGRDSYIVCGHEADLQAWRQPEDWLYGPPSSGGEFFMSQLGELHVTQLDGPAHRRARKFVLPGFGIAAVTRELATVSDHVASGLAAFTGREINMHPALSRLIAGALSLSQVKTHLSQSDIDLMVDFEEGFIAAAALTPAERDAWYASPHYAAAREHSFGIFERIADARLAGEHADDSLDLVMKKAAAAGEATLSQEELTSITYLLLVAGVGNIANMLCAGMWALEQHPVWIARLRDELADFSVEAMREGMGKLPVLKAVISEVERCYLPAPVVLKMAATDVNLMGCKIPAGADVFHLHGLAHFEPERYADPFRFNPARWLEDKAPRANAFGGGVHLCLGMGVTRLYVPLILAELIRGYEWESIDKPRLVPVDESIAGSPKTTRFQCDIRLR